MQTRSKDNIPAIDVSRHQKLIDWLAVAADPQGIKAVMVKATEGLGYIDPQFRRNAIGASAVGLKVGYYHYARPETPNSAVDEAEAFCEAIVGLPADLPHTLDVEGAAEDLGPVVLTAWCVQWLQEVERRTGHPAMVYTGANFARQYLGAELAQWPLWIAHYGTDTPMSNITWDRWSMFQYTSSGTCSGIAGNVDMNEIDADFWTAITGGDEDMQVVKLSPETANNIIGTYLATAWANCNDEMDKAKEEHRNEDAEAWRKLRDWQHALANQLRAAAGIPIE